MKCLHPRTDFSFSELFKTSGVTISSGFSCCPVFTYQICHCDFKHMAKVSCTALKKSVFVCVHVCSVCALTLTCGNSLSANDRRKPQKIVCNVELKCTLYIYSSN